MPFNGFESEGQMKNRQGGEITKVIPLQNEFLLNFPTGFLWRSRGLI